jgi:hypothetical protein
LRYSRYRRVVLRRREERGVSKHNILWYHTLMATFHDILQDHRGTVISHKKQVQLGTPGSAKLSEEHNQFVKVVIGLLEAKKIDPSSPSTFIKEKVYASMTPKGKAVTDRALPNICSLLHRIIDLHYRKEPNDSPEMKAFIESLWQAKERVEKYGDVFIF